jgi:hypothetical protein
LFMQEVPAVDLRTGRPSAPGERPGGEALTRRYSGPETGPGSSFIANRVHFILGQKKLRAPVLGGEACFCPVPRRGRRAKRVVPSTWGQRKLRAPVLGGEACLCPAPRAKRVVPPTSSI